MDQSSDSLRQNLQSYLLNRSTFPSLFWPFIPYSTSFSPFGHPFSIHPPISSSSLRFFCLSLLLSVQPPEQVHSSNWWPQCSCTDLYQLQKWLWKSGIIPGFHGERTCRCPHGRGNPLSSSCLSPRWDNCSLTLVLTSSHFGDVLWLKCYCSEQVCSWGKYCHRNRPHISFLHRKWTLPLHEVSYFQGCAAEKVWGMCSCI